MKHLWGPQVRRIQQGENGLKENESPAPFFFFFFLSQVELIIQPPALFFHFIFRTLTHPPKCSDEDRKKQERKWYIDTAAG